MAASLIDELERLGRAVEQAKQSGFTVEYHLYILSPEWQQRRERIKPKVCVGCNATGALQLHHRVYPPRGASLQAFIDQADSDFSWVCQACHEAIGESIRARRKPKRQSRRKK